MVTSRKQGVSMKLLLISLIFSFSVSAKIIEEGYFIEKQIDDYKSLFDKHPEVTIDHIDEHGFEVYGPKGLGKWLIDLEINAVDILALEKLRTKEFGADYPSFEELEANLKRLNKKYPNITWT